MKRVLLKPCVLIPIALILLLPETLHAKRLTVNDRHPVAQVQHLQLTDVSLEKDRDARLQHERAAANDSLGMDRGVLYFDGDPRLRALTILEATPAVAAGLQSSKHSEDYLRAGGLVAFPTETLYGLSGNNASSQ
jgi:hypothetical protein